MLISQIVDGSDMIQVVARIDGAHADRERREKRLFAGAGGGARRQRPRRADRAQGLRQDRRPRRRLPAGPADRADQPSRRRRICTSPAPASPISARPPRATPCTRSSPPTARRTLTDSMKMFRMGLEGGKPAGGEVGVQPEWFYKGNGAMAVAPGAPLMSPAFAKDAGEEPEIAGIYVIGDDGTPFRVGFALSNEFSDHVTERVNYLYLAHSKLRNASFGPEILVGDAARRHPRHLAHPARRQDAVGKAVPVGRGEHVAHHRQSRAPPLQIHGCSASRATCTSTCSARRRCPSPTASGPRPATCSRSSAPDFGLPLRNPLKIEAPEECRRSRRFSARLDQSKRTTLPRSRDWSVGRRASICCPLTIWAKSEWRWMSAM